MQANNGFIITIPNDRISTYRIFSIIIALLSAFSMLFIMLTVKRDGLDYLIALACFTGLLTPILGIALFKKKKDWYLRTTIGATFVAGLGFILMGLWIGIFVIVLSWLGAKSIQKPKIIFTNDSIVFPTLPKKTIPWNQLENVMLKGGILTLDFKNNQLMQFNIFESDNPELDADAFNKFAAEKLLKVQKV